MELAARDREAILVGGQLQRTLAACALRGRGEEGNLQLALRGRDESRIEGLARGDLSQLGGTAKKDGNLVAEGLAESGFDPPRQRVLAPFLALEDHVPAGSEAGDPSEAQHLELTAQLLVLDPAAAEVHPTQKCDVAFHAATLRRIDTSIDNRTPIAKFSRWATSRLPRT